MASNRLVGEVWLLLDNEPEYLTVGTFLPEKKKLNLLPTLDATSINLD